MSRPAPLLLDGGIGHLLKAKGVDRLVPGLKYEELFLAGALANALAPDAVAAVHGEYVDAGGAAHAAKCRRMQPADAANPAALLQS
jgi:methionine synthase I (cobalamin-dependent)